MECSHPNRLDLLDTSALLLPYLTTQDLEEFVNKYYHLHQDKLSFVSKDCKFLLMKYLGYFDIIRLLSVNKAFNDLKSEKNTRRWWGVLVERLKLMFKKRKYNFKDKSNFDLKEYIKLHKKYESVNISVIDIYLFVVWMDEYGKHFYDFASIQVSEFKNLNTLFGLYRIWLNAMKKKPRCSEIEWSRFYAYIPPLGSRVWYSGPVDQTGFYNVTSTVLKLLDVKDDFYISKDELKNKINIFIDKNFKINKNKKGEITSYTPNTKQGEWIITRKKCEYKECTKKGVTKKMVKWKVFRSKDKLMERIANKMSRTVKNLFWYHDITKLL